ncbi:hypothetical protein [Alcaligenes] [Alcaligenes phenolicus]
MSLYKKAWLFTLFNVVLLVALYFGLPILDRVLGTFGFLVFGFYILGQGLVAMTVFRETLKKTSRFWQNTRIPPAEFPHEADDLR